MFAAEKPAAGSEQPGTLLPLLLTRLLPLLLTRAQVAKLLNVSEPTVKRATQAGTIPGVCYPFGSKLVRYSRLVIEDWIARGCPPVKVRVFRQR